MDKLSSNTDEHEVAGSEIGEESGAAGLEQGSEETLSDAAGEQESGQEASEESTEVEEEETLDAVIKKEASSPKQSPEGNRKAVKAGRDYEVDEDGRIEIKAKHILDDVASVKKELQESISKEGVVDKTFKLLLKHNPKKAEIIAQSMGFMDELAMGSFVRQLGRMNNAEKSEAIQQMVDGEYSQGDTGFVEEAQKTSIQEIKIEAYEYAREKGISNDKLFKNAGFMRELRSMEGSNLPAAVQVDLAARLVGIKPGVKQEDVAGSIGGVHRGETEDSAKSKKAPIMGAFNAWD